MSEFDRRTGVKQLRVRGFRAVRFAAVLKAAGLNILRAAAVRKRAEVLAAVGNVSLNGRIYSVLSVKELLKSTFCRFKQKFNVFFCGSWSWSTIQADSCC